MPDEGEAAVLFGNLRVFGTGKQVQGWICGKGWSGGQDARQDLSGWMWSVSPTVPRTLSGFWSFPPLGITNTVSWLIVKPVPATRYRAPEMLREAGRDAKGYVTVAFRCRHCQRSWITRFGNLKAPSSGPDQTRSCGCLQVKAHQSF